MSGPKVMFGTKCPSITSIWIQSAPAASTARTSSPSRAKSAERMEGAMRRGERRHGPAGTTRLGPPQRDRSGAQRLYDLRHQVDRELREREEKEGRVRGRGAERGDEQPHVALAGAIAEREAVRRRQPAQDDGARTAKPASESPNATAEEARDPGRDRRGQPRARRPSRRWRRGSTSRRRAPSKWALWAWMRASPSHARRIAAPAIAPPMRRRSRRSAPTGRAARRRRRRGPQGRARSAATAPWWQGPRSGSASG